MNRFKKTALTAAMVAGFTVAGTAQSAVTSVVAEGLMYPFVYYDNGAGIDTWFSVHTTSFIGQDTVPNDYTAPHVWKAQTQAGYNAAGLGLLYLNWFNYKSEKVYDQYIPVTPNDKEVFQLSALGVNQGGTMNQVPGYIVIVSNSGRQGQDGDILMMGDAVLTTADADLVTLPVLPQADGADAGRKVPTNDNNCVSLGTGPVVQEVDCSPLVAGTRTDNGDADLNDRALVDLELVPLGGPAFQTLIAWMDRNNNASVPYRRYNDDEDWCSGTIPLPYEVNVIPLYPSGTQAPFPLGWWINLPAGAFPWNLCQLNPDFNLVEGILRLALPEQLTDPLPGPNAAAFVWSIVASDRNADPNGLTAVWAHDVGKIDQ